MFFGLTRQNWAFWIDYFYHTRKNFPGSNATLLPGFLGLCRTHGPERKIQFRSHCEGHSPPTRCHKERCCHHPSWPGHALTIPYNQKMREAGELCRQQGIAFIPVALESLGGWHEVALAQVKKIGSALGRHTGNCNWC